MNEPMDTREKTDTFFATEEDNEMTFVTLMKQDVVIPMACCDCSLVHLVKLSWNKGILSMKLFRDDEITADLRHAASLPLKDEEFMAKVVSKMESL